MFSKYRWLMALALSVLSVSVAAAQGDDPCMAHGGQTNADGQCVLTMGLTIEIDYPLDMVENEIVASTLDPFIEETRQEFVTQATSSFEPMPGPYGLYGTYETTQYSEDIVSLVYTIYQFTGGAHGNSYFWTYTFDLVNGNVISFDDVFLPGSDPLAVIAPIAAAQITETLGDAADAQWIAEGTGENPVNYQNFSLSADGITFYFPPYQVAFYAAGAQTVTIPFTDLAGVLAPEFGMGEGS
ncbi:MAG: DUF3298 and DUF4163 domain-containing protein [Anaerolineae bacterium]|nr:DUF3298 and DUF4163 domain-containing protein [Anaerolineae bacterium]